MSEIKVNKVSPRTNCGTVQLGDSGDTITIPAGASITNSGTASGFGATGSASWNTTVKTGDFTAVVGEGYFVNTTSGEIDVTLPAGTAGAVVAVADYANTADTNNIILKQNGSDKIEGSTDDFVVNQEGASVTLVFVDSTKGWIITDTGNSDNVFTNPFIVATGGTITCCGNYKIHTFTSPGTFEVTSEASSAADNKVDYLVVAGGGGAQCGGAGAGGFRLSNDTCMPAPLTSPLANPTGITATVASFPITVGAGGVGSTTNNTSAKGSDSIFSTITSTGGARVQPADPGATGGSGGGAYSNGGAVGVGNTPPVSPPQGNNGGTTGPGNASAGGGGAGAVGSNANPGPRAGGIGSYVLATGFAGSNGTPGPVGSTRYFASGGGGGAFSPSGFSPVGPSSGGGGVGVANASQDPRPGPQCAAANTGGGGGGAWYGLQGNGGSGIVIIRYKFQ